jgi:hypothetical protein
LVLLKGAEILSLTKLKVKAIAVDEEVPKTEIVFKHESTEVQNVEIIMQAKTSEKFLTEESK